MRPEFARSMVELFKKEPRLIFLTGDLGYMAFEDLLASIGNRFVNAGVAEQNMVSLAAGLAREGFIPFVYNIAPFMVLRPYEQIRNDVCQHDLPVKMVGNGGGYGYGIMGATHHTLEDVAVMRVLPNMKVYAPLVLSDVGPAVKMMIADPHPNYLRLNCPAKLPFEVKSFSQWRKIKEGSKCVVVGLGPVVGNVFELSDRKLLDSLEVWDLSVLPFNKLPDGFLKSVEDKKKVFVIEEHYGQCGINEALSRALISEVKGPVKLAHVCANGYPSGKYGSQKWHQEENRLSGKGLEAALKELLNG